MESWFVPLHTAFYNAIFHCTFMWFFLPPGIPAPTGKDGIQCSDVMPIQPMGLAEVCWQQGNRNKQQHKVCRLQGREIDSPHHPHMESFLLQTCQPASASAHCPRLCLLTQLLPTQILTFPTQVTCSHQPCPAHPVPTPGCSCYHSPVGKHLMGKLSTLASCWLPLDLFSFLASQTPIPVSFLGFLPGPCLHTLKLSFH